jgi:phosphonate transport system substrate-binding protein
MERLTLGLGPAAASLDLAGVRERLGVLLSEALGRRVTVIPSVTYAELLARIAWSHVEIAWLPPAIFVRAREQFDVSLLAASRRTANGTYHGALFTRADSKIASAEELDGTKVAWVDRSSCGGFLFPRLAMMERGIDPPDEVFRTQLLLKSHGAVVDAVARGDVDLGATYVNIEGEDPNAEGAIVASGWTSARCTTPMRVLLLSRPIPNDVLCSTSRVDIDMERRIREALFRLPSLTGAGDVLRRLMDVRAFEPAALRDYDIVRAAMNVATNRRKKPKPR